MNHPIPAEQTGPLPHGMLSTHPDFWVRGEANAETAYNLALKAFRDAAAEETRIATIAERVVRMRNAVAEHEKNGKPSQRLQQLNEQAMTWIARRKAATHAAAVAWHESRKMAALWMQRRSWRVHHGPAAAAALPAPNSGRVYDLTSHLVVSPGRARDDKGRFTVVRS